MQITDVRVRKVAKEGKLKAVVSITIDEEFVVHDIKVIEGEKGLFIAMPRKKALDGEFVISHIRSIQEQENEFSQQFLQDISRHLKKSRSRWLLTRCRVLWCCSYLDK